MTLIIFSCVIKYIMYVRVVGRVSHLHVSLWKKDQGTWLRCPDGKEARDPCPRVLLRARIWKWTCTADNSRQ